MRLLIVANSNNIPAINYKLFDKIVCCDGGAKYVPTNIIPDVIVGDFDSLGEQEIIKLATNKSKIVFKANQDESDLSFALKYCLKQYKPEEIIITGAISADRFDHSYCNTLLLKQIPKNISAKIITKTQEIYFIDKKICFSNQIGKTLSIIPLKNCEHIKTSGLKWEINGDLQFGFVNGISNIIISNQSFITINNGEILAILER